MPIVYPDQEFITKTGRLRKGYYLDGILIPNLDILKKSVDNGWDGIVLVTGMEGSGKSTFVQAVAKYCDPTLDLSRIVFSAEDLMTAIDNAGKKQAIILDEAILSMASQDFASQIQQILIKKFTLIRSRNLYIFLVIPSFFMLRRYFAMFRTRCLLHCYTPDGIKRGYFQFFSYVRKKKLYLYGMKEWNMSAAQPNFRGRFTDTAGMFVNLDEYEAKKQIAVKKLTEEKNTPLLKLKEDFADSKLKLKLDVDKFKTKWKEKFLQQKEDYTVKLREVKKEYDKNLREVRDEAVELIKSKDKEKILRLDRNLSKLLYFQFELEKRRFMSGSPDKEFPISMFHDMLYKEKYTDMTLTELKAMVDKGKEYQTLDSYKRK